MLAGLRQIGNRYMSVVEYLKTDLNAYESLKPAVLEHEGKYVLIHRRQNAGIWDTYEDALQAGYQQFGLKLFLVKRIQGVEGIQSFSRELWAP